MIHEGQLTYEAAGLHKVLDLGEWWLLETGLPLPLGVNLVRRDVGERMGDLSVHVAKIARLRVPHVAVPEEIRPTMARMGEVAEDMVSRVSRIIIGLDVEAAIELGRSDEIMDQLRRRSFTELLGDNWTHGVEAAVDLALLGRYYERIADHAVSVANRVVYVVTGDLPARV